MKNKRDDHGEHYAGCGVQVPSLAALDRHIRMCPRCQERRAVRGIDRLLGHFFNTVPDSNHAREQLKVRIRQTYMDSDGRLSLKP